MRRFPGAQILVALHIHYESQSLCIVSAQTWWMSPRTPRLPRLVAPSTNPSFASPQPQPQLQPQPQQLEAAELARATRDHVTHLRYLRYGQTSSKRTFASAFLSNGIFGATPAASRYLTLTLTLWHSAPLFAAAIEISSALARDRNTTLPTTRRRITILKLLRVQVRS